MPAKNIRCWKERIDNFTTGDLSDPWSMFANSFRCVAGPDGLFLSGNHFVLSPDWYESPRHMSRAPHATPAPSQMWPLLCQRYVSVATSFIIVILFEMATRLLSPPAGFLLFKLRQWWAYIVGGLWGYNVGSPVTLEGFKDLFTGSDPNVRPR
jgi:hypothetical protein